MQRTTVPTALTSLTGWVLDALWRDGGQRQARRNAWSAMVSDNVRARARADADRLLVELALRHQAADLHSATSS